VSQRSATLFFWATTALAAVSVVLVVIDGTLFLGNQARQAEVNQRQLFINQSAQLGRLQEALIRSLAASAVNKGDDQLRDLLAQHGISYTVNPTPTGTANPTAPAPAAATKN
jgi:hypothetical protein